MLSRDLTPPAPLRARGLSLDRVSTGTIMNGGRLRPLSGGCDEHCGPDACPSPHLHCCRDTGLPRRYWGSFSAALLTASRAVLLPHSVFRSDSIRITRSKSPIPCGNGRHIIFADYTLLFGEGSITHLVFNTFFSRNVPKDHGCINRNCPI